MSITKPSWFRNGKVLISNAETCGINKDGNDQFIVSANGERTNVVDDKLKADISYACSNQVGRGSTEYVKLSEIIESKVWAPTYHNSAHNLLLWKMRESHGDKFDFVSLEQLGDDNKILLGKGHGSPSNDQRIGDVPYIKVSDLRSGHVNINPSNMIPHELAIKLWGKANSGLKAYDLISPERASKNIGEFCVLMPGQERVVLTREVIIIRARSEQFDQFYLMWALSLKCVREQWKRVVLMQTNREDVGKRTGEIVIPIPKRKAFGEQVSDAFRKYYKSIETARAEYLASLKKSPFQHHVYLE